MKSGKSGFEVETEKSKVQRVKLGDVVFIDRIAANCNHDDSYVSLEDIDSESGRVRFNHSRSPAKSSKFRFTTQHVLYGKLRPYLRKVGKPTSV